MNRPRGIILSAIGGVYASGAILIIRRQSQPPSQETQRVTTEDDRVYRYLEGFPADIVKALPSATSWTLLSLNPGPYRKADDEFHEWPVLGRLILEDTKIAQETIQDLEQASQKWRGGVALCFDPRHGLAARSRTDVKMTSSSAMSAVRRNSLWMGCRRTV